MLRTITAVFKAPLGTPYIISDVRWGAKHSPVVFFVLFSFVLLLFCFRAFFFVFVFLFVVLTSETFIPNYNMKIFNNLESN